LTLNNIIKELAKQRYNRNVSIYEQRRLLENIAHKVKLIKS